MVSTIEQGPWFAAEPAAVAAHRTLRRSYIYYVSIMVSVSRKFAMFILNDVPLDWLA
ncbi:hypothetical protein ACFQU2_37250 [Siccirubricoccus deserti]